ncbi:hypothetical protein ASPWEDRAFT_396368 [Aspergillus wentii DTO 134E9]|uniref:Uncharacterized protein n=1 Tax=Aspergillus wentii DTO 134E9 TaxID=1073089 RepID=A0A1L9RY43_ASPWE|nr:uncharacterized protein ASPWEDRAFT_396368 [Aspergillus wentii DTO 134E9]OJJ39813.1 hypothetical protein ASPWEDRAFT_396368 [Aspergillus wentii DTO 134E9]
MKQKHILRNSTFGFAFSLLFLANFYPSQSATIMHLFFYRIAISIHIAPNDSPFTSSRLIEFNQSPAVKPRFSSLVHLPVPRDRKRPCFSSLSVFTFQP